MTDFTIKCLEGRIDLLEDRVSELAKQVAKLSGVTLCKCGSEPGAEPHKCPFAWEIHNNDRLCNCCTGCTRQCGMEI